MGTSAARVAALNWDPSHSLLTDEKAFVRRFATNPRLYVWNCDMNGLFGLRYAEICDMALMLAGEDKRQARRLQRLAAARQLWRETDKLTFDDAAVTSA